MLENPLRTLAGQLLWRGLIPDQLHLVLRPLEMQLHRVRRWPRRDTQLMAAIDRPPAAQSAALPELLAQLLENAGVVGAPLRIWLDDLLLRQWTVDPPANASRWSDLLAAQAHRFQKVFDEDMGEWVCAAPQSARQPYLGVAMPRVLHSGLLAGVAGRHCVAVSIQPESVGIWNHWRRQVPAGYWFGCVQAGTLRLGVTGQGALLGWRRLTDGDGGERAEASGALMRERAGAGELSVVWAERLRSLSERQGLLAPRGLALCGQGAAAWQAGALPDLPLRVLGQQSHIVACLGGTS